MLSYKSNRWMDIFLRAVRAQCPFVWTAAEGWENHCSDIKRAWSVLFLLKTFVSSYRWLGKEMAWPGIKYRFGHYGLLTFIVGVKAQQRRVHNFGPFRLKLHSSTLYTAALLVLPTIKSIYTSSKWIHWLLFFPTWASSKVQSSYKKIKIKNQLIINESPSTTATKKLPVIFICSLMDWFSKGNWILNW